MRSPDARAAWHLLDALEAPTCTVRADSEIVEGNSAWRQFASQNGGHPATTSIGSNYLQACDQAIDGPGAVGARHVATGLRAVLAGDAERYQSEYPCHGDGEQRWFSVRIVPLEVDGGPGALISHVDVTAMHLAQDALAHQVLHDALTGLPNGALLADRLGQALVDSIRGDRGVGVAYIDIDHFKRVNDSLGHAAGDALLVQVARRLTSCMRAGDTLARYSGDEFVAVWRDVASDEDAAILGGRLARSLTAPFEIGAASVNITASVGVVVGQPTQTGDELMLAADAAMYDAKSRGRGRVRVFSAELRDHPGDDLATEVALQAALSRSELVLHYQPVIDLWTGRVVGVEALVRWQHPERGLLPPRHFIPTAELSGLIVPLGRWALDRACRDAAAMTGPAAGLDVAVNLSARQLTHPDVVRHVRDALESSGLDPRRLMLEVTESAVLEDDEVAAVALDTLSALGVRIAIDDFGTGYSSLLYLRRYPIDALKLDRAFVSGLTTSPDDEAICASVVSLAHAVGATSIAEGVETVGEYAALRGYGCQQAQGFLWSPAVPIEELAEVVVACHRVPRPARTRPHLPHATPPAPDVAAHIASLHRDGASLQTIAAALNRAARSPQLGGRWTASTVARHLAG
ncbi:putative bifunctional diguanylate cyclase/phosphodiesterase [Pengzhenrongella frigida]|uniref:putative bifunctional diguanylate cyclase/phosphodiesterase n=1 Tax=Pengzhenrongella frigida TaxID=1259133 RepID=UPI0013EC189F|nr:EAL domain-containing protein [Cellulomonas sp. HLT2-17]